MTEADANPLARDRDGPFDLPPWGAIRDDHLAPAVDAALAEAEARAAAIAADPAPPEFANTVLALERAMEPLDRVMPVISLLAAVDSNPARRAVQRQIAPRLGRFRARVAADPALFARVEAVWEARDATGIAGEDAALLDETRRRLVRGGAGLGPERRARLGEIAGRLGELSTLFAQNLLAEEAAWSLPLAPGDLADLPPALVRAARAAGAERGAAGPVLTLARTMVVPFLQHSPDRHLRERVFRAWTERGANAGATDNREVAAEILALRAERAGLLGYRDFAALKLDDQMAGDAASVRDLLWRVWHPARAAADAEAAVLAEALIADGEALPLCPWDWRYYARAAKARSGFDEAEIRPYLTLDGVIAAAFDCAGRLFGIEARPVAATLHHPDARAWEVTRGGRHLGVFVGDYFAREGKRSGAWCAALRRQRGAVRPVVVNVCNFARPDADAAALLSFREAHTVFHEFGHALHHLLSDVAHASLSGTSVARDFVELPSQLFQNWLDLPEVLKRFARHVDTGAPMPADLRDRMLAARRRDTALDTMEYLASAFVDLGLHAAASEDVAAREAEILAAIGRPEAIVPRHAAAHFAHIFAGEGYAAGYYGYLWADVLAADAFAAFREAGDPFDPETARRLERAILSRGGTGEAQNLYAAFRGRMPSVDALLAARGLGPPVPRHDRDVFREAM